MSKQRDPDDLVAVLVRTTVWGGGSTDVTTHIVRMTWYNWCNRERNNENRSRNGTYKVFTDFILIGDDLTDTF
ncbi:hypothetical protein ABK933_03645 [Klebsiella aerogenes]|uniref:hypothetical protein n=1 Tax=Klebsiella aerogenes TaxID=548 RepID=UPI00375304A5